MPKEIGPKEKQLRAMREARVATQRVVPAPISQEQKQRPVKRKPRS